MDRVEKRASVPVQNFEPGSGKVTNVKSKLKACQSAAWSTSRNNSEVKFAIRQFRLIKAHDLFRMCTHIDGRRDYSFCIDNCADGRWTEAWIVI